MKKMKYVIWTLNTLTNVKRITTEELMKLNLKDKQIVIYPGADNSIGASVIDGETIYTSNEFPIMGLAGIIQSIKKKNMSFKCRDLFGKPCTFTPKHSDILFIIEEDKADEKWLKPEYAWVPD